MIPGSRNMTAEGREELDCGNMTENFTQVWGQYQYWCEGVLFTAVGGFGIIGNVISISILATREMRKYSFNHLLATLSCFDLAFILCCLPVHTFPIFGLESWFYAKSYQYILYPFTAVFFTGSIYMTLSVTIERYIAVCHPYRHREYNYRFNVVNRILIYTLPVLFFSLVLNIPKFYETKVDYNEEDGMTYDVTEVRLTPEYIYWYTISYAFHPTLTLVIVPFLILVILNGMLYRGIHKARANTQANNRHSETNLAVTLVSICSVFFVCHALRLYLGLKAVFLIDRTFMCMKEKKYWIPELNILCMESISHLLTMICASSNFIIYSTINKKFQIFIKKRYRSRFGICVPTQTPDDTVHSNKLSRYKDGRNLRLSCPSGEELEMANINIIKNFSSIDSDAKQNSSSFWPGSFIFKQNGSLEGNEFTTRTNSNATANKGVCDNKRTNVTTDVNEEIENKHNRKCHSSNTDTSSKNVIILNGSRKIPKVSLKVKKVGRNIDDKSLNKTRRNASWNNRHKTFSHRKMSRSWSSGSKCQLTLTDDGSVSYIHFPETRNLEVIEYLPIYPKKTTRVKITQWRKRSYFSITKKI